MKNKIKSITLITSDYPAPGHIAFVFVKQLVHAIIEQGVMVTVIAPQSLTHALIHREKLLPRRSMGNTESGMKYNIYRPYSISFGQRHYFKKITGMYNRYALKKTLSRINTEVLYSHFWDSALVVHQYASDNKIPLFVACGESGDHFESTVKLFSKTTLENMLKVVSGVIAVSSENKRLCIDNNIASETNIEVIPNCIKVDAFCKEEELEFKDRLGIKEDDFVIAFVGGFIPRKGPDRVAKAIVQLNDPRIKVMFIGKPFLGYDYEFDCPGIIYKGTVKHDLLPKYLNCADIFVLPTQTEGCCNAIVEALAIGLPVVSSIGAFNDDILDENNSIRIDPDDVDAIANAIKTMKDNPELRKRMSEYSLSRHEEYSIEGRAKKILNFIQRKISKQ